MLNLFCADAPLSVVIWSLLLYACVALLLNPASLPSVWMWLQTTVEACQCLGSEPLKLSVCIVQRSGEVFSAQPADIHLLCNDPGTRA